MRAMSEPQPRPAPAWATASTRPRWTTRTAGDAHNDLLAFLELSADHFGRIAVGQTEADEQPSGPAVDPEHEHVPRRGRLIARTQHIVAGLLRRREDLADASTGHVADPLSAPAVLRLTEPGFPELGHLLATLFQDGIQLGLL